jgi:thioredoxin reductase
MITAPRYGSYDVVVIGAGPAGLAAAATTAEAGLSTLLLDENAGPGGQVWRAIASTPVTGRDRLGADYWAGADLVRAVRSSGAEIIQLATVWSLDRQLEIGVSAGGASAFVRARRVIVATGALERPFPVPGWTLPGVMTAGAVQTMLKSSALVPDGRTVIAGQGPLVWLLAAQILRLGGRIDRILDTTERRSYISALPHAFAFLTSPYFAKGLALMREVRAKVPVVSAVRELAAAGDGQLATVNYVAGGRRETMSADLLLLHQGVVPNVNLAMAAGIEHRWDERQLCWSPVLDPNGGSSIDGIVIAGDGAGIGGAEAAVFRGRIAARAAIEALAPRRRRNLLPWPLCGQAWHGPSVAAFSSIRCSAPRGSSAFPQAIPLFAVAKRFRRTTFWIRWRSVRRVRTSSRPIAAPAWVHVRAGSAVSPSPS